MRIILSCAALALTACGSVIAEDKPAEADKFVISPVEHASVVIQQQKDL
jgi:hypothetical protein